MQQNSESSKDTKLLAIGRHAKIFDTSVATENPGKKILPGALKIEIDDLPLTNELVAAQRLRGTPGVQKVLAYAADARGAVRAILFEKYSYSLSDLVEIQREALAAIGAPAAGAAGVERLVPPAVYVPVIRRLVDILMHARRRGVYHGHLTPSHVLFSEDGNVAVCDWSCAAIMYGNSVPPLSSIDATCLALFAVLMAAGVKGVDVRELEKEGRIDEVLALLPACTRELVRRALFCKVGERPALEEWDRVWPSEAGADLTAAYDSFMAALRIPQEEGIVEDLLTELGREPAGARAARAGRAFKSSPGEAPAGNAQLTACEDNEPLRRANTLGSAGDSLTIFADFAALAAARRAAADGNGTVREVAQAQDTSGVEDVPVRSVCIAAGHSLDDTIPAALSGLPGDVDWDPAMGRGRSQPGAALFPAKSGVSFASARGGRPSRGDEALESIMSSEFERRSCNRRFVSSAGDAKAAAGSMPGKVSDRGELKGRVGSPGGITGKLKAALMWMIPSSCFRPSTPVL